MCTKSLNFRHCHHGNQSNAKLPKNILVTAEQNVFFSVFLCYPFVIYLIWYRKKYLRIDIHIYKFRQRKLKGLPRRNNSETQVTLDTRHRMNTKTNKQKLEAQWAEPVLLTFHSVLRKLYTEPSIGASYRAKFRFIWLLGFKGEDFF